MTDRMRVSDETDPLLMHHWVDRWDCGLDGYGKAAVVATLHDLIDRLSKATGGEGAPPPGPGPYPADSAERIATLQRRVAAGESMHHPGDNRAFAVED